VSGDPREWLQPAMEAAHEVCGAIGSKIGRGTVASALYDRDIYWQVRIERLEDEHATALAHAEGRVVKLRAQLTIDALRLAKLGHSGWAWEIENALAADDAAAKESP
jgi:hypothetical protein